jgi:carboxymethylenebutenolidase
MKRIDRATFVGTSAALAASSAAVGAQTTEAGPKVPVVAEDDPSIHIESVKLVRPDAVISAYTARPKNAGATTPGIVIAQHVWGVDKALRDFARRFAKLGYIAIVPGLYDRLDPIPGDNADEAHEFQRYRNLSLKMYEAGTAHGDLQSAADWMHTQSGGKVGIYGNCMGGGLAMQQIAGNTSFGAACVFYGPVRNDRKTAKPTPREALAWAATVTTPTFGGFGGADSSIDVDDVKAAFDMMRGPHQFKIYPNAPHGFLDDERPEHYVDAVSKDSWTLMAAWFKKYLTFV